ncbi:glycosyltransferase [Anaerovibrio lipolyticus]|uniref:glycosyltransferase family protein n=1 Tax=Anaerovibrio lipolyticus TaxID=82374 RepID=UPI0026EB2546|nr:glycosyltransferase [Anaerovibrio lipolyticus]MBE6105134.1 glycosyltransferase family 1 protein [Anaerovibrio lipolyticus]
MDDGKKVLVYTTSLGHPSMKRITHDIVQGFEQLGVDTVAADLDDLPALVRARNLLLSGQIAFSAGVNDTGRHMVDNDGRCIYGYLDTPFVSIMLDAPYNVATDNIAFPCINHYVCLLDKTHQEALKICYPKTHFAGSMMLPLGGSSGPCEDEIFSMDRPLDVVYSASIYHGGDFKPAWMEDDTSPFIVAILKDVVDYMLANPVSMLDAFKVVLDSRGLCWEEYIHKFTPYMFSLFFYVKHRRRYNAVEALAKAGFTVDVYGSGWEWVPFADKLRVHGEVDYEEVLDAFAKTKVVFQDQAEFNNGGHDRVFTAMLNGAAVVSEYSTYLENKFEANKDIFLFDWKNTVSQLQIVDELINNESLRLSTAISAYGKASANHRWANRANSIMEMMSVLRGN